MISSRVAKLLNIFIYQQFATAKSFNISFLSSHIVMTLLKVIVVSFKPMALPLLESQISELTANLVENISLSPLTERRTIIPPFPLLVQLSSPDVEENVEGVLFHLKSFAVFMGFRASGVIGVRAQKPRNLLMVRDLS